MSDDEDSNASAGHYSAYGEQVQRYKDYLQDLRRGMPSGISERFGSALDLLPESELKKYQGLEEGDSVIPEGGDPEAYRQALEELISEFQSGIDQFSSETDADVVGVTFQDGQKLFMLSDGTTRPAPVEEGDAGASASQEPIAPQVENLQNYSQPILQPESQAINDAEDFPASDFFAQQSEPGYAQEETFAFGDADDISQQLASVLEEAKIRTSTDEAVYEAPADNFEDEGEPDFSVKNKQGKPLWDVYFGAEGVEKIRFYNGIKLLSESTDGEYTLRNSSHHVVERVKSVAVDQTTGNIYYLSIDGQHITTWLNNGSRIDHYRTADGADKFYLLDVTGQNQIEIINVSFDLERDSISYETADGDEVVTIRSRKLDTGG